MAKIQTIEEVVEKGLCTGCGTCVGICPSNAVESILDKQKGVYVPHVDREICVGCGLCYTACPGHGVDFNELNRFFWGELPKDITLGSYLTCYIGHAKDYELRYNSASGGVVTALANFALEEGIINGILVTRMKNDNPLEPEPFIARTTVEITSAAKSKYCPVPANIALKEILQSPGNFGVVGLPCHIQGTRKAELHSKKLRDKIVLHIGIACSRNYRFQATENLLKKLGISKEDVKRLDYRGKGWPGSMVIQLKDGREKSIPVREYYDKLSSFQITRCTLCSDHFCELSDLSCGDAWIPDVVKSDNIGSSFIVSRTELGEQLLKKAAAQKKLELCELNVDKLLKSQGNALFKKKNLSARMFLFRLVGKKVPVYKQRLFKPDLSDYVSALKFYLGGHTLSGQNGLMSKIPYFIRLRKDKITGIKNQPPTCLGGNVVSSHKDGFRK